MRRQSSQNFAVARCVPCAFFPFRRGQLSAVCRLGFPPWPDCVPCASLAPITADRLSAVSPSFQAHGRDTGHGSTSFSGSESIVLGTQR
jgi:hypothetical protein